MRRRAAGLLPPLLPLLLALGAVAADGPPRENGPFRRADLVEPVKLEPTIRLDIRYATAKNFVGRPVYAEARAFLERPAAEALVKAHRALKEKGYGLLVFDAYRPWSVTKLFWDVTPADKKAYVADPAKGSRHNRGCAVDVSLYELSSGREVDMGSPYDEASERSHVTATGLSAEARSHREVLRSAMEAAGFFVYAWEWWHFDYRDWLDYPVLDIPFREIGAMPPKPAPKAREAASQPPRS